MIIQAKPRLNEILKMRNMTQRELEALSGVPQGSISRFDTRKNHDTNHLFSIAYALSLNIEDLFEIVKHPDDA
ncbi:helix-turn-helix domain-containing protein [Shimazuella kribbensis]|uniref:helix-turn-helix domain-containing protein n=1 Tax=Shimazuella kribbensis TaxID=139808 RepID=UPI00048BAF27|nr:helix-turn-helix transcriptional regulator [Shimazuella kribbensis]